MNILHPTTGQLLDRLTILGLKIQHSPDERQRETFRQEVEEISTHLPIPNIPDVADLQAVNAELWLYQGRVAACADLAAPAPNDYGVILFRLNQRRVKLIEEIDQLLGEYRGPEKVYP